MSAADAYKVRARVAYYLRATEGYHFDDLRMIFHLASKEKARTLVARGERLYDEEKADALNPTDWP